MSFKKFVDKDGRVWIHSDFSKILEQNKIDREHFDGFTEKRTMRRVASIPTDFFIHIEIQYGKEFVRELLQDPEALKKFIAKYYPEFLTVRRDTI